MEQNEQTLQAVKDTYHALDLKFAKDIVVINIGAISPVADYFIIASGANPHQIQAIASAAEEAMQAHGIRLRHIEGLRSANWVLLDFGSIIVHIFDKESRQFYNLERVWSDAETISIF